MSVFTFLSSDVSRLAGHGQETFGEYLLQEYDLLWPYIQCSGLQIYEVQNQDQVLNGKKEEGVPVLKGNKGIPPPPLTAELNEGEWSASNPFHFTLLPNG